MKAVSLFSGAGGLDLGLERAGVETVLQCDLFDASHLIDIEDEERRELTRYGQALQGVLERHWPGVERVNDVRNVRTDSVRREAVGAGRGSGTDIEGVGEPGSSELGMASGGVDLVHFGSPCQDLSVAGKQSGFVEGGRSHLFFEGVRVIRETRPGFALWENVAGSLSSNGGRDFAAVLAALADAGAVDIAWRVLDARWFGVPQRRRRVFVVADFGGERAAEVLFEPAGGAGAAATRGAAGQDLAFTLAAGARGTGDGHGNVWNSTYVANPLGGHHGRGDLDNDSYVVSPTIRSQQRNNSNPVTEASMLITAAALTASAGHHGHSSPRGDGADNLVPIAIRTAQTSSNGWGVGTDEQAYTLDGAQGQAVLAPELAYAVRARDGKGIGFNDGDATLLPQPSGVRRLTPRECERLMGWPDDWTRWTADGREISDSHRYRMAGNGVVASVAEWIGHRLVAVAATLPR